MKKILPILIVLTVASCKKEEFSPNQTDEFSIQSSSNGANYSIKIALPDDYDPSTQKYAAIYVLDGEENFSYVAEKCKDLSSDYSTSNVLVVSIGYGNDRSMDYTPTETNEGGGGAEEFLQFIKDELIPKMENDYGADTSRESRMILGHSFGGLCAAYAFTNLNDVFGNYLMLCPSLWYDNEILFRMEQDRRSINQNSQQLVFMGLGQMENSGRMLAPFEAFYQRLKNNYLDIKITHRFEPHLGHMGSKNPNISKGLEFYFRNR